MSNRRPAKWSHHEQLNLYEIADIFDGQNAGASIGEYGFCSFQA